LVRALLIPTLIVALEPDLLALYGDPDLLGDDVALEAEAGLPTLAPDRLLGDPSAYTAV